MTLARIIQKKEYENQIAVFRRHWLVFLLELLLPIVLGAIPFGVHAFLRNQFPEVLAHAIGGPALILGASAYELGVLLFLFTQFLDYELDMWVITNDRFINIEQQGLFARTIGELDLWRVQDVTSEVKGVFPTFFNYGDVHVQTAGAVEHFRLEQVPNPHEIRRIILDMAEIDREYHAKDLAEITKVATSV